MPTPAGRVPGILGRAAAIVCAAACAATASARADDAVCAPAASAGGGEAVVIRAADEPLAALARRLIPPRTELMADPVEVDLAPLGRVAVLLFREEDNPEVSNYTGWVLVPEAGQARSYRRVVLPPMDLIDGHFDVSVKSVFGAVVGAGPGRDLCVLYQYYRNGSGTDYGDATEIYRWTGTGFVLRPDASDAVVGLSTAGKIRERLKRWRPAAAQR